MRRTWVSVLLLVLAACGVDAPAPEVSSASRPARAVETVEIRLATTTSTRDSGLLDALLPQLERDTGVRAQVLAVGSGQALRIGADGDADLLLTHDPNGEQELVASGAVIDRRPLMFNDFVIVGPASDPAGISGMHDAAAALRRLSESHAPFLSRGDDSGTHRKERRLWKAAGVEPSGDWYREAGQGMGATLAMAAESGAYTLADRSTWSAHAAMAQLPVLVEGDPALRNPYAVMRVNPERHPHVKSDAALRAEEWLTGPVGRAAIRDCRPRGTQLFFLLGEGQ